jgi:trehalose/maltose hydrolase-like predicted phosphorylase
MVTLATQPASRRRIVVAVVAVLATLVAAGPARPAAAAGPAATQAASSATAPAGDGWTLATTSPADAAAAPAYLGNGYVGTRVPADGAGYAETPIATETHVAGVYADKPDVDHGGTQLQGSVNLPGWTQLDVLVAGRRYRAADASSYRQALDLRRGVVTTTATWSAGGRVTRLAYDVALDRARERVGLVRLRLTPSWSGRLRVRDVLGAGADLTPGGLRPVRAAADRHNALLVVRTAGIGTTVAEAARLRVPAAATVAASADTKAMTATRTATIPVRAGRSYEVAKVVGFATSVDAGDAAGAARQAARGAPTPGGILAEHAAAWAKLWTSDIVVGGQPALQGRVRAAQFFLLASARPDVDWSISPVGLSAGGYNNHVFWDAETWMYPALLAQHPAEASTVVDYRYRTRAGARRNAQRTGYEGQRHAWESALTGDEVTPTWAETGRLEQHVTADVALAQWQYYLATGDQGWLRDRGWPVLSGAADFWASRAERGADGHWHINQVEGPDEQNWPVDDSVYTNATARTTLELAARAARLLGLAVPARWTQVADGLAVLEPTPLDGLPAVRPEFRAYAGQQVKQADVVLLTYPWEYPQPAEVDRSNLDYYTPRYDPDGPAMTDSVNSVIAAQLGIGCSAWTYTLRSLDPFVKAPYEQFTEARSGQGVFTFLTGEGGFLQEFLYGYTGLRWREDRLRLDPMLPPQLAGGLKLTGLHWQGRVFDVAVGASTSTVTLRSGAPATVETPDGTRTVSVGAPLTMPTRTAGPDAGNLARCRPVEANAADPSAPAVAAVDGSTVTGWTPDTDPATPSTLTVTLDGTPTVGHATLTWLDARPLAPYEVQVRTGGDWRTVATVSATADLVDKVSFDPVATDAVRLRIPATRFGGQNPELAELAVTG